MLINSAGAEIMRPEGNVIKLRMRPEVAAFATMTSPVGGYREIPALRPESDDPNTHKK